MTILALDYGTAKIGVARSDETELFALPLEVVVNDGTENVFEAIRHYYDEHAIRLILVGVPTSLSGDGSSPNPGGSAAAVQNFMAELKRRFRAPIVGEDERLTTKLAQRLSPAGTEAPEDAVAAQLILQSYLDRQMISH